MTDKELKKQIKTAYKLVPSDREKTFIREHEERGMHLYRVILVEARYMCAYSFIWGISLFVILMEVIKNFHSEYAWAVASLMPLCVVCPLIFVGKSERYRMAELESACRFSLKFIRLIRLLILDVLSLLFIVAGSGILKDIFQTGYLKTFIFCSLPFLLNVWGCLCITRKWKDKENIYGCVAMTVFSCMLPMVTSFMEWELPESVLLIVIGVFLFLIGRESFIYVKGSEDLTWSLC